MPRHFRIQPQWAGFAFLYLVIALLALHAAVALVDEAVHYGQIDLFDHGDFRLFKPFLTMLPGYHALASASLWAMDWRSLAGARFVSALIGLCAITPTWYFANVAAQRLKT